jgi:hypothetical protein
MVDAMISRFRVPDLARRGRFRPDRNRFAASVRACASRPESGPEASSLATTLPSRPSGCDSAGSSRPVGDLMASTI